MKITYDLSFKYGTWFKMVTNHCKKIQVAYAIICAKNFYAYSM